MEKEEVVEKEEEEEEKKGKSDKHEMSVWYKKRLNSIIYTRTEAS